MKKKLCMKTPTKPFAHHSLLCQEVKKDIEMVNEEQIAVVALELSNVLESITIDIFLVKDKTKLKKLVVKQKELADKLQYMYKLLISK